MFLVYATILLAIEELGIWTKDSISMLAGNLFATAFVAFYSHRIVLQGEQYSLGNSLNPKIPDGEKLNYGAFIWRFFLFSLVFTVLMALIVWWLFATGQLHPAGENTAAGAVLIGALIALPPYGIVLSIFGTVLPAAAINGDTRLSRAFARGRKRFWQTLWRLFSGSFLFGVLSLSLLAGFESLLVHAGFTTGIVANISYYFSSFLAFLTNCIVTLLAATALSMAYLEAEAI